MLLRRIVRGLSQGEQQRPRTHPLLRIFQVVDDPGVGAPTAVVPAHRATGDAVEGLALNILVQNELPRNGERTVVVGEHGRPIATPETPAAPSVGSIAQAVPQQQPYKSRRGQFRFTAEYRTLDASAKSAIRVWSA